MNLFDHHDADLRQRLIARGWEQVERPGSVTPYWRSPQLGGVVTEQAAFAWLLKIEAEEAKEGPQQNG